MRPMLAAKLEKEDLRSLRYPLLSSAKLDGIRALVTPEGFRSRTLKPFRNPMLNDLFEKFGDFLTGMDGEVVVGEHDANVLHRSQSFTSNANIYRLDFKFMVFDIYNQGDAPYWARANLLQQRFGKLPPELAVHVKLVPQWHVKNPEDVIHSHRTAVEAGLEGVVLRRENVPYKFGRSTLAEAALLKFKAYDDSEAEILSMHEAVHNANPAQTNEVGYTKRLGGRKNSVPLGMLGSMLVRDLHTGMEFEIGTGWTQKERIDIWENGTPSKFVKYKFYNRGEGEKPSPAVFKGWHIPQ